MPNGILHVQTTLVFFAPTSLPQGSADQQCSTPESVSSRLTTISCVLLDAYDNCARAEDSEVLWIQRLYVITSNDHPRRCLLSALLATLS